MSEWVLVVAMTLHPLCKVNESKVKKIVKCAKVAANRNNISPVLLVSVILIETGGRNVVATGRGKGRVGCDVGVGQIHVPGCKEELVKRYMGVCKNVSKAAYILRLGRELCESKRVKTWYCQKGYWWSRYNPGSRSWTRRLLETWRAIESLSGSV